MISLEGVAARRATLSLASISLGWGAGVHTLLGSRQDGGPLLLALIAGASRPRVGRVRVLDGAPGDPAVRRRVSWVGLESSLPEGLRVHEALSVAAAVRGEAARGATERLGALGIEALAERTVASLSRAETHAVALAEAVTSSCVRVLLLEEPLTAIDPRAAVRLPEMLRTRARDDCAIVVATSSVRDAGELGDDHVLLRGGAIVGRAGSIEELAGFSPTGAALHLVACDAKAAMALVAALVREPDVDGVERDGASLRVRGRDAMALARAAGRATLQTHVDLIELRVEPPSLEEARDAGLGIARATFDAAYAAARERMALGPANSSGPTVPRSPPGESAL